jgi:hypothetical protein
MLSMKPLAMAAALFAAAVFVGSAAHAAPALAIDFGETNATHLQPGFQNWYTGTDSAGPKSTTFTVTDLAAVPTGTVSATVAGGTDAAVMANNTLSVNIRTRGSAPANSGSFTNSQLLRDRLVATGGIAGGLFLELTGFTPHATFAVQAWGFDARAEGGAKAGSFELFDRTAGANTSLGSFTATAGQLPVDNDSFSVTGTVQADATGKIVLMSLSNIDGRGIFNAVTLTTLAIPEPAAVLILLPAAAALFRRR